MNYFYSKILDASERERVLQLEPFDEFEVRQAGRQTDRQTDRHAQTDTDTYIQTDRHARIQTDKQTDTQKTNHGQSYIR